MSMLSVLSDSESLDQLESICLSYSLFATSLETSAESRQYKVYSLMHKCYIDNLTKNEINLPLARTGNENFSHAANVVSI